jgi:hypothetical protein
MMICTNFSGIRYITNGIQDDHSNGRKRRLKRPKTARKREITALIFAVFQYISGMTDYGDVLTPFFVGLQPFTHRSIGPGKYNK